MPKKQQSKQKQKQKQYQKTTVTVNVGNKSKSNRKPRVRAGSPKRNPSSISVVLQGSTMNLPPPPTNEYNSILKELEYLRNQRAQSGSLIPRMATNDLLNRVTETNPFQVRSTNTQTNMLDPFEGVQEEVVESQTTINPYADDNNSLNVPIDQDFIRQQRFNRFAPSFESTVKQIATYDDGDYEDKLARFVSKDVIERMIGVIEDVDDMEKQIEMRNKREQDFLNQQKLSNIAPSLGGTLKKLKEFDDEDLEDKLANEVNAEIIPPDIAPIKLAMMAKAKSIFLGDEEYMEYELPFGEVIEVLPVRKQKEKKEKVIKQIKGQQKIPFVSETLEVAESKKRNIEFDIIEEPTEIINEEIKEVKKKGGRPKGSKNKPKEGIIRKNESEQYNL